MTHDISWLKTIKQEFFFEFIMEKYLVIMLAKTFKSVLWFINEHC